MNSNPRFHCFPDLSEHGYARLNIIHSDGSKESLCINRAAYICASRIAPFADEAALPCYLRYDFALLLTQLEALNDIPDAKYKFPIVLGVLWNRRIKATLDAFFAAGKKASS